MTNKPQVGKTIYRIEVQRGITANRKIQRALKQLVDECGSRNAVVSMLVSQAAVALTDNLDALHELERIVKDAEASGSG